MLMSLANMPNGNDMERSAGRLRPTRRAGDSVFQIGLRELIHLTRAQWEPVRGGRLLLLVTGVVITFTAAQADPGWRHWPDLVAVVAAMLGLLLASYAVPWSRLPRRALLGFPGAVGLALAILGLLADGLGANFAGLLTLCFAYLGLTQKSTTCVTVLPIAIYFYVAAYGGWSKPVAVRLPIALVVWTVLAILLAELVARQNVLAEQLRRISNTDVLTGLGNRRDLEHRLSITRAGDTLVMCDFDHFERLNNARGHAAGDTVLADFGAVMRASLREGDYAGRYGGEEFVLVLERTSAVEAESILRRLRQRFATLQPDVTFSAGIARCAGRSVAATLEAADLALDRAKDQGRNRDCVERSPA
jgi:diguanylate cyclase (GGDEF)-like protein